MTGAICRIGAAIKKADPDIKVTYMPGIPFTFIYKAPSGGKCASFGVYMKPKETGEAIAASCASGSAAAA